MNNYTNELRDHNLKATPQRIAISDALYLKGHLNLDDLYEIMKEKFNSISLATIYKNIKLMLDNAYIQEVKIPHAKSVYELSKTAHAHLCCTRCQSIEDISIDFDFLEDTLKQNTHFLPSKLDLVVSGLCTKCQ